MGFCLCANEFQSCLGDSLLIDIIKERYRVLLAVKSWIEDKAQLVDDSTIEHAAIQLSTALQGNCLDAEVLLNGFENQLGIFEILHYHIRDTLLLKERQVMRGGCLHWQDSQVVITTKLGGCVGDSS